MTDVSSPPTDPPAGSVPEEHVHPPFDVAHWSDTSSQEALRLIAASVAQMVGFEVAVISMVRDDVFVSVVVEGPPEVQEALARSRTPVAMVVEEIAHADDWGRFQFVPHERNGFDIAGYGWVPDLQPSDHDDAWHANDMLLAPLRDAEHRVVGLLSIDVPLDGLRPDAGQRQLLERYAAQAERALLIAFERDALAQRLRLTEAARQVVRSAASQPDPQRVLLDCRSVLLTGFRADELAIRAYSDGERPEAGTPRWELPAGQRALVRRVAHDCWRAQRVLIVSATCSGDGIVQSHDYRQLRDFHARHGFASVMIVPIGAGAECMGQMILMRRDPEIAFSPDEQTSCFEIARDIGQSLLASRNLRHEQHLLAEMTRLATYRTELLSTVSHELKNPLTALNGHLDILAATETLSEQGQRSLGAMGRASGRLRRVVDDLLLMAESDDVAPVDGVPVDVGALLHEAADLATITAGQRDVVVEVDLPPSPVLASGDQRLLDRVVTNLLSNAIKYSRPGTSVVLSATDLGEGVQIVVSDQGIGISPADRERLFTEFFRSTNPTALAEPGTGLGLSISARIVARHGGTIEVDSTVGEGSTFRVLLPAAHA